jgi:hypothetical protein
MKFYFPDSQDQIDPNFDFALEEHPPHHVRQRDDLYAHEALNEPASSGVLVSMGLGRYTLAQRHRFARLGIREFYRLDRVDGPRIDTLGDCGAFSYVKDEVPPYSVDEVLGFYADGRFDAGVSIDHVITGFDSSLDHSFSQFDGVPADWLRRLEVTLALADDFFQAWEKSGERFQPVGAAQGWSPKSYATCVEGLQSIGYQRIALGGLVGLKTREILSVLAAIDSIRDSKTQLHLLGVTRTAEVHTFQGFGVTSIDSTAPFRQAFKDDADNYHTLERNYVAVRIPQVDGNPRLKRLIASGQVDLAVAQQHERACLSLVREYAASGKGLIPLLDELSAYAEIYGSKKDHREAYRRTLEDQPWRSCACAICKDVGVDVVLFRGSERNKRRGFHNLWVFNQRLQRELSSVEC